ncbi:Intracellular serine protease [Thermoflexales bacterium]|nr:Intracellular serine protease [Thermoflexales bacterium]
MPNQLCQFDPLKHLWRWLALISLFVTACQSTPLPVATSILIDATKTAPLPAPTESSTPPDPTETHTPPSPSPIPTLGCTPQSTFLPTQSPAPVSIQAAVTTQGVVQGRILPSPYLVPTYARAPIAWVRSTGQGITVTVTRNHSEDLTLVKLIAPDAQIQPLTLDRQMRVAGTPLLDVAKQQRIRLLAVIEPSDFDPQILRETVPALNRAGVAVFINGDLSDGSEERDVINALEANGAITVGRLKYGVRIQGRDIYQRQINLFAAYGADTTASDRGAVLTVAGVGALVLAATPTLNPPALKQQLIATADLMYTGVDPVTNLSSGSARVMDQQTGDFSPTSSAFQFRRVNAAGAVGVHLAERWPLNALNVPTAWKTATGRGVIVGVIDAGFYPDNPILKDHLVDMFPKQAFSEEQHFPHGTVMAKTVLAVAPDASLVLLHDSNVDDYATMARSEAEAIDYAIQQGVRVLTSSNKSWANTPEVHAAIDRAIAAGIVFVWSDYTGPNEAVIRPGYWRSPSWEVGTFTFFLDEDRPAELEGGLSYAAPQIAAIAALILQNEPHLTPSQVKQRIVGTATVLPNGNSIADAAAAVENRPVGRRFAKQNVPTTMDSKLRLIYQSSDGEQGTLMEIEERHQNWPIASWPQQDILLYRTLPATTGSYTNTFHLVAYRDVNLTLMIEWPGNELDSGDQPAKLTLLPDGEWQPVYSIELDARDVPPLHIEVMCDRVRLSWNSADGARLERGYYQDAATAHSSFRLLSFEMETPLMPDLIEPIY